MQTSTDISADPQGPANRAIRTTNGSVRVGELIAYRVRARAAFHRVQDAEARLAEVAESWDRAVSRANVSADTLALLKRLRRLVAPIVVVNTLVALSLLVMERPSRFDSQWTVNRSLLRAIFSTAFSDVSEGTDLAPAIAASNVGYDVSRESFALLTSIGGRLANDVLAEALTHMI